MRRRVFLFGAGTVLLAGCSSTASRCVESGQLGQALCRQDELRAATVADVTVGMLLGAALGAGFAVALSGDPVTGALGGAMLGGSVAYAAGQYLAYRRQRAGDVEEQALAAVVSDIHLDVGYARQSVADAGIALAEAREAIASTSDFASNTDRLVTAEKLKKAIGINKKCFGRSHSIYNECISTTALSSNRQAITATEALRESISVIERQEIEYLQALRLS